MHPRRRRAALLPALTVAFPGVGDLGCYIRYRDRPPRQGDTKMRARGALRVTRLRRAGGDQRVVPDLGVLPAQAPEADAETARLRDLHAQSDRGGVRVPDVVVGAVGLPVAVMV